MHDRFDTPERSVATLIPAPGPGNARVNPAQKRVAACLRDKLDADYLCWQGISVDDAAGDPDFIVFHPTRGLLLLQVADWKLESVRTLDRQHVTLCADRGDRGDSDDSDGERLPNPLEQARQCLLALTGRVRRDPKLIWPSGSLKGEPFFPCAHGVVLASVTRAQFDGAGLGDFLPGHLVICQDEMHDTVAPGLFQRRLWDMFPIKFRMPLSAAQIDRIRWHLFPDIRIRTRQQQFATGAQQTVEVPGAPRVMDLLQEQLARSPGEGHRIIHGVAGSGKTLILEYRAEHLARTCRRPILILCYNKTLATRLHASMASRGLHEKVHVFTFHAWCARQLTMHGLGMPHANDRGQFFEGCIDRVLAAVEQQRIPTAQYDAVLIDEGHDFRPDWFRLLVRMPQPDTQSLLVLYDDAQSIHGALQKQHFSYSSVGLQAQGRSTVLKKNYRNTHEILSVARAFADDLLAPASAGEDRAPIVEPVATGRRGSKPILVGLPTEREEAAFLAERLSRAKDAGLAWHDMAVLYGRVGAGRRLFQELAARGIPLQWQKDMESTFSPRHDSVKLLTMHSSRGLEFPLVCLPGIGTGIDAAQDLHGEARLLYVAMTRATQELVMTHAGGSVLTERMREAMGVLESL